MLSAPKSRPLGLRYAKGPDGTRGFAMKRGRPLPGVLPAALESVPSDAAADLPGLPPPGARSISASTGSESSCSSLARAATAAHAADGADPRCDGRSWALLAAGPVASRGGEADLASLGGKGGRGAAAEPFVRPQAGGAGSRLGMWCNAEEDSPGGDSSPPPPSSGASDAGQSRLGMWCTAPTATRPDFGGSLALPHSLAEPPPSEPPAAAEAPAPRGHEQQQQARAAQAAQAQREQSLQLQQRIEQAQAQHRQLPGQRFEAGAGGANAPSQALAGFQAPQPPLLQPAHAALPHAGSYGTLNGLGGGCAGVIGGGGSLGALPGALPASSPLGALPGAGAAGLPQAPQDGLLEQQTLRLKSLLGLGGL
ncbi:hypothetical protein EMIHUDRAFT_208014 [Emiliania huxleyi CCMP1516]|uniref:SUZ-C domain-containing protein n=2 Tax=Emiliania huxleyi TaxID=2903 RepID=A0A0D3JBS7_EMIH1|nr:hypothetical protein EMIHUDRAFT_208014 [Emiliania huxleyi CCMP1516]EOD20962.1 hypothetical protein EMIHUDRAFT_208014 [Emiliania huxleyi CCMP1516]|eukprot:XP_005773391.1 hypothetical protein EMIHUDRAFT_208014 [Emiliania huxleyi CCMP1516]